ncbi:DUF2795 domain-containing protein [Catellatospora bangladeshensis]|uniref:DUF2795 domain-containing protein n=1 Tax=Catellatospora bangladeshensis TaxID=310355 RepID=UPI003616D138
MIVAWPAAPSSFPERRATPPPTTDRSNTSDRDSHRAGQPHRSRLHDRAATRDELLAFAACSHARPDVIAVIRTLPERPYPAMRDLWTDLAHIPIGE